MAAIKQALGNYVNKLEKHFAHNSPAERQLKVFKTQNYTEAELFICKTLSLFKLSCHLR